MKNFDIESYLEGELKGKEKEVFESEMKQNQTFREEVELSRSLIEDLDGQFLRETVTTALKEGSSGFENGKKNGGNWFWLMIPLLLIVGSLFFFLNSNSDETPEKEVSINTTPVETEVEKELEKPLEPVSTEKKEPTILESLREMSIPPSPPKQKKPSRPIAETNKPSNIPSIIPRPNIRGQKGDEAWDMLLDSIWASDFPPANVEFNANFQPTADLLSNGDFSKAFVRLRLLERKMPENDTLLFLKGHCLTEMREGAEALNYFDQIKSTPNDWKASLEWYRAFSFLLNGEVENAFSLYFKMKNENGHPFQEASEKAYELLQ